LAPHIIHCVRLDREAEGLNYAPWPGELGQRIYHDISLQAWNEWLVQQTTLINEYRLNPLDPQARQFIAAEMEKFLFGGEDVRPDAYSEPRRDSEEGTD